jgi:hypothetical protein
VLRVLCRSATCSTETEVSLGGVFFGSRFVCALFIDFHSEEAVEAVRLGECPSGGGELVLNSIIELALAICLKGKLAKWIVVSFQRTICRPHRADIKLPPTRRKDYHITLRILPDFLR